MPYVPATDSQIENVLKFLKINKAKSVKLLDIGSGDGRIVIGNTLESPRKYAKNVLIFV